MESDKFEVVVLLNDGRSYRRYEPSTLVDSMLLAAKAINEESRSAGVTITSPSGNQANWTREKGRWH